MSTPDSVPPFGRRVAQIAADAVGGDASVHSYRTDDEQTSISVLTCTSAPGDGWMTCSTVNLHVVSNLLDGVDVRVELMVSGRQEDEAVASLVATSAFFVMANGWLAAPGVVFPRLVAEYFPMTSTPHLMWVEPFPYPELSTVQIDGLGAVHWLMGVPISEDERGLLLERGFDTLDARLNEANVEYYDFWRPSSV